jgi:hypothetical protein
MNFMHRIRPAQWARCAAVVVLVSALAGCKREDNRVYSVPKETPPVQMAPPVAVDAGTPMPVAAPEAPELPALAWTLPDGWQEKPPGEMRAASFSVTGKDGQTADVSVIPLPIVGRDLELVNMWRQQVQLPPATDPDAARQSEPVAIGADQGRLFNFASEQPMIGKSRERILVAMVTRGPMSYFFKMTGEESFVASQKPGFIQFLKSVSFNKPAVGAQTALPPGHPAIGDDLNVSTAAPVPAENSGKPAWTVPPGWREIPPSEFLLAGYAIAGTNGAKADVNVAMLGGEGGGVLANVNRWRRQLGLPPVAEDNLPAVSGALAVAGAQATLVDMTGVDAKTGGPARLIGVILPQPGRTWFYKLMGDEQLVGRQKEAFLQFIRSAKDSNAP